MKDEGFGTDPMQLIREEITIAKPVSEEQIIRVVVMGEGEQQFSLFPVRFPAEHLFAGLRPGLPHAEIKAQTRVEQYRPSEHHTLVGVFFLGQMVVVPLRFPPEGVALDGCRHELEEPAGV